MLVARIIDVKAICLRQVWTFDDEARDALIRELQPETDMLEKCGRRCRYFVDLVSAFSWDNKFWLVLERCIPGSFEESVLPNI